MDCNIFQRLVVFTIKVQSKVAWLIPLKEEIHKWKEWVQIGQVTRDLIRTEGFYATLPYVLCGFGKEALVFRQLGLFDLLLELFALLFGRVEDHGEFEEGV